MSKVSIIAAMAEPSGAIGLRGGLPWRLPADMRRFRQRTMGHTLIMGRVTWEPIAERGLPGRRVIVLSRGDPERVPGAGGEVQVAGSLEQALEMASQEMGTGEIDVQTADPDAPEPEVFIAGGAAVYQQALALDLADRMYLTLVQAEVEADTFFPAFDRAQWEVIESERRPADPENPHDMTFETLQRRAAPRPRLERESGTNDTP